ncbi:hypothetical protein [Streptomyces sp. NPDC047042]|uniref:hypothetical protein n=1 Tax=Streptomyces sp. NPDC047042 TaxID=3154807 RepID=UPI0033EC8EAB
MVRRKPEKRASCLTQSARTRQARQAQERVRAAADQDLYGAVRAPGGPEDHPGTDAADSGTHESGPTDERFLKRAAQVRYALLAIALVMLLWFIVAMPDQPTSGLELSMPTWVLDVAALSPLLVLIRFWSPAIRRKSDTLEFDLRVISGLYFLMAFLGASLGGYWQLWPGVGISAAVHAGIWYTNRRTRGHD